MLADQVSRVGLYSAPMDGSAPATQLDRAPFAGTVRSYQIRPDGAGVVFRSELPGVPGAAVFAVPIDGSALPLKLSAPFPSGSNSHTDLGIAAGSNRVVYVGDQEVVNLQELYGVPYDGSAPPVRLNGPLIPEGDVDSLELSRDGTRLAFRADAEFDGAFGAFTVPPDGSAPAVRIQPDLLAGPVAGVAVLVQLSADSRRAIYMADQEEVGKFSNYVVLLDGSSAPVKLSAELDVHSSAVTPDDLQVVYVGETANGVELFSGPSDGSHALVHLATLPPLGGILSGVKLLVGPDSQRVLYRASWFNYPFMSYGPLFSVPVDGSSPAVQLSTGPVAYSNFDVDSGSRRAVFLQEGKLYSSPMDGSLPAVELNPVLVAGGQVLEFLITPDGQRVLYRADQEVDERFDLYSAPIDGGSPAARLNSPAATDDVLYYPRITADSQQVVYRQAGASGAILYRVSVDGSSVPAALAPIGPQLGSIVIPVQLGATGRVVYADDRLEPGHFRLFSVPLAGGTPLDLSGPPAQGGVQDFLLSPDGSWAVYHMASVLFAVPVNGSAAPVQLHESRIYVSSFDDYRIEADGHFVAFLGVASRMNELYRVSIDGSAPPVRVNAALPPDGDVTDFWLTPDGHTLVYRADQETDEAFELFARREVAATRPSRPPAGSVTRSVP